MVVYIEKNGKNVRANCSRCKAHMEHGGQQFGKPALRCPDCGWVMIPTRIMQKDEEV